jgi:serine/threonine protein kinase
MQLKANKFQEIIEWIPFDRFENVTYLSKGGFGTVYKAEWLDGYIYSWDYEKKDWGRVGKSNVCLKSLNNSTNKNEFLQEVNISHYLNFIIFYIIKYIIILFIYANKYFRLKINLNFEGKKQLLYMESLKIQQKMNI